MFIFKIIGIFIIITLEVCNSLVEICDRRPLETKTDPLPPDNQFVLDIEGIRSNKNEYNPGNNYTVHLHARDGKSIFIAFTISLREDSIRHTNNLRKRVPLSAGKLQLFPDTNDAVYHKFCQNTIIQSDITAKTSVKANWEAPGKGNKCVTIYAVVAVRPNVWYSFEGPLSKTVCEDPRKDDDMPPMENTDCKACEDARYELTFKGLWSPNTHLDLFPSESAGKARFSDIVGASHSESFTVYKVGAEATLGLQMLAEQGNTTGLEFEIEAQLGKDVRTVIKATSPPEPNMDSVTQFRASRDFHRLTIATAIQPSPDWFLGVSNMELCSTKTGQWADNIVLNLYPLDAGTDQGINFNSSNEMTLPHQAISLAVIGGKEPTKPFARLELNLIRTYITLQCSQEGITDDNDEGQIEGERNEGDDNSSEEVAEPKYNGGYVNRYLTTTTSEEPPSVDSDSSEECPMSPWEDFACEGECVNNTVVGFKYRQRYHIVDGVAVGKYEENEPSYDTKEVTTYCLRKFSVSETVECQESCEEPVMEEVEEDSE